MTLQSYNNIKEKICVDNLTYWPQTYFGGQFQLHFIDCYVSELLNDKQGVAEHQYVEGDQLTNVVFTREQACSYIETVYS